MNEIEFKNGHHLDVTTMNFIQESYTKPINDLGKDDQNDNYVVWGLNGIIEDGEAYVTEGAVMLNGEILPFRKSKVEDGNEKIVKAYEEIANINSSGQADKVMKRYFAKADANGDGSVTVNGILERRLQKYVYGSDTGWLNLTNYYNQIFGSVSDTECRKDGFLTKALSIPQYRIMNNNLYLRGIIRRGTSWTYLQNLGKLPDWIGKKVMVPARMGYAVVEGSTDYTYCSILVTITEEGEMRVNQDYSSTINVFSVNFDSVVVSL